MAVSMALCAQELSKIKYRPDSNVTPARRCPGPWQECRTNRCPVDGETTCHQPAEEGTCGSRYIRVVRVPRSQPRDIPVTIVST